MNIGLSNSSKPSSRSDVISEIRRARQSSSERERSDNFVLWFSNISNRLAKIQINEGKFKSVSQTALTKAFTLFLRVAYLFLNVAAFISSSLKCFLPSFFFEPLKRWVSLHVFTKPNVIARQDQNFGVDIEIVDDCFYLLAVGRPTHQSLTQIPFISAYMLLFDSFHDLLWLNKSEITIRYKMYFTYSQRLQFSL